MDSSESSSASSPEVKMIDPSDITTDWTSSYVQKIALEQSEENLEKIRNRKALLLASKKTLDATAAQQREALDKTVGQISSIQQELESIEPVEKTLEETIRAFSAQLEGYDIVERSHSQKPLVTIQDVARLFQRAKDLVDLLASKSLF